jgi:hypothetical protein
MLDGLVADDAAKWLNEIPIEGGEIRASTNAASRERHGEDAEDFPLMVDLQSALRRTLTSRT